MVISVFERVENMVGKGEIACTSNFSFSHNVFKRLLSQRCQNVSLCGNGLTHNIRYESHSGTSAMHSTKEAIMKEEYKEAVVVKH